MTAPVPTGCAMRRPIGLLPRVLSPLCLYPRSMADTDIGLPLPNFGRPPVVEVAMSFGFTPIVTLQFAAMADLRAQWIDDYPLAEEQPFLEPVQGPLQTIRVEIGPAPRRLWLKGDRGDRVIQIQRDRLIANWRAAPDEAKPYPRYQPLRAEFLQRWSEFSQFVLDKIGAGPVDAQFAEVTYVNVVPNDGDALLTIGDVLTIVEPIELTEVGLTRKDHSANWQSADLRDRLSLTANLDPTAPGAPIVFQITANTQVDEQRDPISALDRSHHLVVGTFGVITTEAMQKRWGRQ
jgi:uncharacterized protein (TIGR04255 family)